MYFLRLATPLVLLGFVLPSTALTLGQPQGAAWVGRPLDVVIPLSLGEGERQDSFCAEADMVQGSTRIDDKRLTVSVEPGARPGQMRMRVRSAAVIEEPVVQLTVRAGCEMNASRQYVLLADMPVDMGAATDSPNTPRALPSSGASIAPLGMAGERASSASSNAGPVDRAPESAPVRRPRPAAPPPASARNRDEERAEGSRPAPRAAAPRRATAAAKPPAAAAPRAAVAKVPASGSSAVAAAVPAATSAPASGARLQLDALDPASVRNPSPAASAPGVAVPSAEDATIAAAALAASAAANAEALQRATERMQSLEATLVALREQSAQNQRMLVEMRSELAEARDSRYRNPLVYVLVLLLLLALVALALLWRLARGAARPAWWGEAPLQDNGGPATRQPLAEPTESTEVESSPVPAAATSAALLAAAPSAESLEAAPDTMPPLADDDGTPARYVNTEELFDVQQQSDFFVSLGQHDQAIAVLSEHIADNPGTSALAYLDLLRIYHSLDRRDDYAHVGMEFERAFNAQLPAFEQFTEVGHGLEHYRATLARIEAQWPGPATLGLIEELVFRKPGTRGDESFDLAAYRELLLLYSVAKEVIDPESAPPTPVTPLSFLDTHDAPLEATLPARVAPEGFLQDTQPDGLRETLPVLPEASLPSFYGSIDTGMDTVLGSQDTVLSSPVEMRPRDMGNEIEFDATAFETVPGDLGAATQVQAAPSEPPAEPLPDLNLFDPLTEAEIAPKPKRRR